MKDKSVGINSFQTKFLLILDHLNQIKVSQAFLLQKIKNINRKIILTLNGIPLILVIPFFYYKELRIGK